MNIFSLLMIQISCKAHIRVYLEKKFGKPLKPLAVDDLDFSYLLDKRKLSWKEIWQASEVICVDDLDFVGFSSQSSLSFLKHLDLPNCLHSTLSNFVKFSWIKVYLLSRTQSSWYQTRVWRTGTGNSRYREFSIFLVVSEPVSEQIGTGKSLGTGIGQIWYR